MIKSKLSNIDTFAIINIAKIRKKLECNNKLKDCHIHEFLGFYEDKLKRKEIKLRKKEEQLIEKESLLIEKEQLLTKKYQDLKDEEELLEIKKNIDKVNEEKRKKQEKKDSFRHDIIIALCSSIIGVFGTTLIALIKLKFI